MSSVGWAYGICKDHGIDTKDMSVNEVINKANELQKNSHSKTMANIKEQEINDFNRQKKEVLAKEYSHQEIIKTLDKYLDGDFDTEEYNSGIKDNIITDICKNQGFTNVPKRLSMEGLSEKIKNGASIIYRGVSDTKYINDFNNGDCFYGRGRLFGNGIYMSYDKNEAMQYAQQKTSNVAVAVLDKDFKFAPDDLRKEHSKLLGELNLLVKQYEVDSSKSYDDIERLENKIKVISDFGKYVAFKGYDGYNSQKGKNLVVLNRSKLFIGENYEEFRNYLGLD